MPKLTTKAYDLSRRKSVIDDIELCLECNFEYFKKPYSELDPIQKSLIKRVSYLLNLKKIIFESFYEDFVLVKNWNNKRFYDEISTEEGIRGIERAISDKTKQRENEMKQKRHKGNIRK